MAIVIGVRFKKPGKVYYFDPCGLDVRADDAVIVETIRGVEMGECARAPYEVPDEEIVPPLRKVVRLATEEDVSQVEQNRENERRAYDICQEKIAHHKLEMKLVDVEYAFDCSKIIFYFTANGRVDFRALVKDLASVFKTRIELRQIGVRDEAKMLGGLGPCGRPICCGTFLGDFQPVSIKMAKEQNLSLNPTKISGLCGRLMCCLKYEQEHYEEARKHMPRVGKDVITPDGRGHVIDINVLRETVRVRFQNGDNVEVKEYMASDVQRIMPNDGSKAEESAKAAAAVEEEGNEMAEVASEELLQILDDDTVLESVGATQENEAVAPREKKPRPPRPSRAANAHKAPNASQQPPSRKRQRQAQPDAEGKQEAEASAPKRRRGDGRKAQPDAQGAKAKGSDRPPRQRRPGNGSKAKEGQKPPRQAQKKPEQAQTDIQAAERETHV